MLVVPANDEQRTWCNNFLQVRGHMGVSKHAHWIVWERGGMPQWVIALDDWIGSTCQLYMASQGVLPIPRSLIKAVFHHGFCKLNLTHMFGLVNSKNASAMRLDQWIGFKEILRVPGAHEGGGDLVVFDMTPAECRWLEKADG